MPARSPAKPFASPPPRTVSAAPRLSIRPLTLYMGFAALLATNVVMLVALLMTPDIAKLFAGQADTVLTAYEDRISELRLEVDRLQSRNYAQAGDINLQLQDLQQQQELLLEQHQYVKQLADKASELGIEATALPDASQDVAEITPASASPSNPASEVAATAADLNRMMDDSRLALAALSDEATDKTDRIVSTLKSIGISPKLPALDAVGGPLLPAVTGAETPALIDSANDVAAALERYRAARSAADLAPIHSPLASATRLSSTFGNRTDPFTGRIAFHSGMDFAAPQGTSVLSAGAGKVKFVGQISGYGNVVEIDHGNGLVTRYGHLSAFLVKEGQIVRTGTPIAKVGSTGRSTGPHLHFEVRRSDDAVNPSPYLKAGKQLQTILIG